MHPKLNKCMKMYSVELMNVWLTVMYVPCVLHVRTTCIRVLHNYNYNSQLSALGSHLLQVRYFVILYGTIRTRSTRVHTHTTPLHLLQIQNTVNNHRIPMNPMVPDALRQRWVRIEQTRQSN